MVDGRTRARSISAQAAAAHRIEVIGKCTERAAAHVRTTCLFTVTMAQAQSAQHDIIFLFKEKTWQKTT